VVRLSVGLGVCALLTIGLACGGGPTGTGDIGPVASIEITPDSVVLTIGQTAKLRAMALDSAGRPVPDAIVQWVSYDTARVSVSATGVVKAHRTARATIEASVAGVYGYATVKVPGELAALSLYGTDSVLPGDSVHFTATFRDSAGNQLTPTPLVWSVTDTVFAEPASDSYVLGRWPGTATVVASSGHIVGRFNLRVLVPVASLAVSPPELTVASGSTYPSTVVLYDTAGGIITGRPVHWTTSSRTNASIDSQGFVTALTPGDVAIVANAEKRADTAALHVRQASFIGVGNGDKHSCAISNDHALWCWGSNQAGQLGVTVRSVSGPVRIPGATSWSVVRGGAAHTCALTSAGAAYCWGANESGQLGDGTTNSSSVPVPVAGLHTFVSLAVGGVHGCGITVSGQTHCWGSALHGKLGNGALTGISSMPVLVNGGLAFTSIAAGAETSCGLVADGSAYCWGHGLDGLLGSGDNTDRAEPFPVFGALKFQAVSAGGTHACGIALDGGMHCWGRGDYGQIGSGGGGSGTPTPIQLQGITFNRVSAGVGHTCAISTDDSVYCWGWNIWGQSGLGGGAIAQPVGIDAATALTAGGYHSCAIRAGLLLCWGLNHSWQLGAGAAGVSFPDGFSATPVRVTGQR
jgi:alpha-tubulin suppressor-like RCC1 family protein